MSPPTTTSPVQAGDLPPDVTAWVAKHFNTGDISVAIASLRAAVIETGERPSDRLLRSAVLASKGQLDKLDYYIRLLAIDWRDVIVAGEYEPIDHKLVRVRDLNNPIVSD